MNCCSPLRVFGFSVLNSWSRSTTSRVALAGSVAPDSQRGPVVRARRQRHVAVGHARQRGHPDFGDRAFVQRRQRGVDMDRDAGFEVVGQRDVRDAPDRHAADLHLVAPDQLSRFVHFQVVVGCRPRRRTRGRRRSAPRSRARRRRAAPDPGGRTRARSVGGGTFSRGGGGGGGAAGLGGLTVATGFPSRSEIAGARTAPAGVADPLLPGTGVPGLSGIAAAEGPLATVGSGISPSRAISLIHSFGVSAESSTPAACAPPLLSGLNVT